MDFSFDFNKMVESVKNVLFKALLYPWKLYYQQSLGVKTAVVIILVILTIMVLIWIIRNRDNWQERYSL